MTATRNPHLSLSSLLCALTLNASTLVGFAQPHYVQVGTLPLPTDLDRVEVFDAVSQQLFSFPTYNSAGDVSDGYVSGQGPNDTFAFTELPGLEAVHWGRVATDGASLYSVGGYGVLTYNVEYVPIASVSQSPVWQSTTILPYLTYPFGRALLQTFIYQGNLYVLGGYGGSGQTLYSDVDYAPILSGGALGSFVPTTSLPLGMYGHSAAVSADGVVYVAYNTNLYSAQIAADGSLGPWVTQPPIPGMNHNNYGNTGMAIVNNLLVIVDCTNTFVCRLGASGQLESAAAAIPNPVYLAEYSVYANNGRFYVTATSGGIYRIDGLVTGNPPLITAQPQSLTLTNGVSAVFTVTASGTSPFGYRWQENGAGLADGGNISGSATSTLTLSPATLSDAGNYTVIITNSYGSVTSTLAKLTVLAAPAVTSQPQSQTVPAGSTVAFGVSVTAYPPPSYQWTCNGTSIVGATQASLTLENVQLNQSGSYAVSVSNSVGFGVSGPATLAVFSPPGGPPGSERWQYPCPGDGISTTPSLGPDGTVYLAPQGALVALSAAGTQYWTLPLSVAYGSPTVSPEGTIYLGAWGTDLLYAVNSDGTLLWSVSLPGAGGFTKPPSLAEDGTIYVPINGDPSPGTTKFYAVNPNGTFKWSFELGGRPDGAAVGYDGAIYFGSVDTNRFFALNPDGTAKWSYSPAFTGGVAPAIGSDGTIYAGGSQLLALTPEGTLRWSFPAGGSPSIASDGTLYFAASGTLFALNPDGSMKWAYATGAPMYGPPAISRLGTIYVSEGDRGLLALNPDGTKQWEFLTGTPNQNPSDARKPSPTIAPDGTVYFPITLPDGSGVLYAVQGDSGPAESPWPMLNRDAQHSGRIPFLITNQPHNQTVLAGSGAEFEVGVAGAQPCTFQWRYNGADLPNQTNSALLLSQVGAENAGAYTCLVSNRTGAYLSGEALLTPLTTATASAVVTNGFVVGATITDGGYGYTNTPTVSLLGGGGSGAVAVAVVTGGVVVAVEILDAGGGYTNPPVVVIAPPFVPQPTIGIAPRSLLSFTGLAPGTSYQLQSLLADTWSGLGAAFNASGSTFVQYVPGTASANSYRLIVTPVPSQASATARVVDGFVVGATVTSGGAGYSANPVVSILNDAGGSNAMAIASVSGGAVTGITITDAGIGYTNAPSILIAPPPANALLPMVTPLLELNFGNLSPYGNYQLEFAPTARGAWTNLGGTFTPASAGNTQYLPATGVMGFFRVRFVQ